LPPADVSFAERDEAIAHFADHQEVVLWFEHDLFDQLQLMQILDWFSHRILGQTRLALISGDAYLGPMRPEQLVPLFQARHEVNAMELKTTRSECAAFCSPHPAVGWPEPKGTS
jgi:hypothetical protein